MTETKWTSGNWTSYVERGERPMVCTEPDNDGIGYMVASLSRDLPNGSPEATAHLIAAAPDLARSALIDHAMQTIGYTVEAQRWLAENGVPDAIDVPWQRLAKWQREQRDAALAKARGERHDAS